MSSNEPKMPKMDEFGTVYNHIVTYEVLARTLLKHGRAAIAWTDQDGTQLDIFFQLMTPHWGPFQGGVHPFTDLMVAVMRQGAFAFDVKNQNSNPSYIGEKLHMNPLSSTTFKLATLINRLRKQITFEYKKLEKANNEQQG
jgi:hypothetical protein